NVVSPPRGAAWDD
uniref:Uncharacterized protein n=1 Tax=Amphimedon queenslandica TaxID=400682 RepID=A0A1X7UZ58_AMPQE